MEHLFPNCVFDDHPVYQRRMSIGTVRRVTSEFGLITWLALNADGEALGGFKDRAGATEAVLENFEPSSDDDRVRQGLGLPNASEQE